jgi:hypothetical protein
MRELYFLCFKDLVKMTFKLNGDKCLYCNKKKLQSRMKRVGYYITFNTINMVGLGIVTLAIVGNIHMSTQIITIILGI